MYLTVTNHKSATLAVKLQRIALIDCFLLALTPGNRQRHPPVQPARLEDAQVLQPIQKHRNSKTSDLDSDSEPEHESFLPDSLFDHQERQREGNHPSNMAPKTRSGGKSRGEPRKRDVPSTRKADEDSDEDAVPSDQEEKQPDQESKETILELQKRLALAEERVKRSERKGSRGGRSRKGRSDSSALENLVYDTAKSELFKFVKFISSEEELIYATTLVMGMLTLKEHEGLTGDKLAKAEAKWVTENCETVRKAINEWRNYVQGELQKFVKEALKSVNANDFARIPTAQEMFDLIMRKGLGKKDPNLEYNQWKFDVIWDEQMSKVSGHGYWSQGKRHHGLMSFHKPPNAKDHETYVSSSDEAFLVTLWENYYDRWVYLHKKEQLEAAEEGSESGATGKDGKPDKLENEEEESDEDDENQDPKKSKKGAKGAGKGAKGAGKGGKADKSGDKDDESDDEDDPEKDPKKDGQEPPSKEKDPEAPGKEGEAPPAKPTKPQLKEVICPYTRPNGGAQRFGGWNNKGRKRYNDLVDMIDKNRREQKKYLTQVETEALKRIREFHDCDEREARRKKKRNKTDDEDEKIDAGVPAWMRKK